MGEVGNVKVGSVVTAQDSTILQEAVPESLAGFDIAGPLQENETYGDRHMWIEHPYLQKIFLLCGRRDANGNRNYEPNAAELTAYYSVFGGIENFQTVAPGNIYIRADGEKRVISNVKFLYKIADATSNSRAIGLIESVNDDVRFFFHLVGIKEQINLDSPKVVQAFAYVVSQGLITQEESDAILS